MMSPRLEQTEADTCLNFRIVHREFKWLYCWRRQTSGGLPLGHGRRGRCRCQDLHSARRAVRHVIAVRAGSCHADSGSRRGDARLRGCRRRLASISATP